MMSTAEDGTVTTWVELWKSVPCTLVTCGEDATAASLRTFTKVTEGVDALSSIPNAYSAPFVDFGENVCSFIVIRLTFREYWIC